jgi:hypothetical protein
MIRVDFLSKTISDSRIKSNSLEFKRPLSLKCFEQHRAWFLMKTLSFKYAEIIAILEILFNFCLLPQIKHFPL